MVLIIGINGEKINDKGVGVVVFLIKLMILNVLFNILLIFGFKIMELIIIGICIVVEFKGFNVINFSGVKVSKSKIVKNIVVNVNFFVLFINYFLLLDVKIFIIV